MCYLIKMQICFLSEHYEEANELMLKSSKLEKTITSANQHADHLFYQSIIITASVNRQKPVSKTYAKILYSNLKNLQKLHKSCPNNFGHKYYLVAAEIARLDGKPSDAADLYRKAIVSAAENGFTQNEAIASELTGKFFYSVGNWKAAEAYLRNAYDKYKLWGADTKLNLLEKEYPFLMLGKSARISEVSPIQELNLNDRIAEALKSLAQEKDTIKNLECIMDIIFDITSANKGCLLVEKDDELYISYLRLNSHSIINYNHTPLSDHNGLPHKLIYYTFNTYETIVLNPGQDKGIFTNDPYISENHMMSQLCIPLILHGILLGVLYLEQNCSCQENSAECVEAIKTLSCQALLLERMQLSLTDTDSKNDDANNVLVEELTPREKDVLRLIASGNSNREIANDLALSVNTVKTHVLSIYGKLNVNRRSQAALMARDLSIVEYDNNTEYLIKSNIG